MNLRFLFIPLIILSVSVESQVCLTGILAPSGAGCGCLAGCNLAPYGGPNCGSTGVAGDCTGGYQLLTFSIPVPSDCQLKVTAVMQQYPPGCTASGGDAGGAGDRLKVEGSTPKSFLVGSSNSTLYDEVTQQGGNITISAYANRADEIVVYTVEYVSGNCPICNMFLPVELINFDVEAAGNLVTFDWTTLSELNNDYFIIEHSRDLNNWSEIIRKDGAGNSSVNNYYSANAQIHGNGVHYFRLKQVDFNGTSHTGPTAAVTLNGQNLPSTRYNASSGKLQVYFPEGNSNDFAIQMHTIDGRIIDINPTDSGNSYMTEFDPPNGMFIITVRQKKGDYLKSEKMMVQL